MKLDFILVAAIMVVLIALPFVLLPLSRNSALKKLTKKFMEEGKKNNLNTQLKENWNQNFIGLDPIEKKLLFVQRCEEDFIVEVIDLKLINSCKASILEILPKESKSGNLLRQVNLDFTFKNSQLKKSVNLFDYDLHFNQDLEVKHGMKWAELINQHLSGQSVLGRTA